MCTNGEEYAGSSHRFEEEVSSVENRGDVRLTTKHSLDAEVRNADLSQVKDLELSQSQRSEGEMQRIRW